MTGTVRSLAVAGAWGYIGRKFVDAGLELGLDVSVLDPGPPPADAPLDRLVRCTDDSFYDQPADLFHLALHPEHRAPALSRLLQRARHMPMAILNEKPMAAPECPQDCAALIDHVAPTQAVLLFDFPELFDPLTARVVDILQRFDNVQIDEILIQRSKDREDPSNPRNNKKMVHIQYQESVHCMAWVLFVLGQLQGGAQGVLANGCRLTAEARPYAAPNPQAYAYVVDGRVAYDMELGPTRIQGCTDFTRGASWAKTRRVRGRADGKPFELEMDYLEGAKYLRFNGQDQSMDADGSSYTGVLQTFEHWLQSTPATSIMSSTRLPNPAFARLTYCLSSLLWRSSHTGQSLTVQDADDLVGHDVGFAEAVRGFPRYA